MSTEGTNETGRHVVEVPKVSTDGTNETGRHVVEVPNVSTKGRNEVDTGLQPLYLLRVDPLLRFPV